jgi:hypothetical protein
MPNAIAEYEIGPLNYQIKRDAQKYTLWLGGCRIGRPRDDKPGEIWEWSATTLGNAEREMEKDAKERLQEKIADLKARIEILESTREDLRAHGYEPFRLVMPDAKQIGKGRNEILR